MNRRWLLAVAAAAFVGRGQARCMPCRQLAFFGRKTGRGHPGRACHPDAGKLLDDPEAVAPPVCSRHRPFRRETGAAGAGAQDWHSGDTGDRGARRCRPALPPGRYQVHRQDLTLIFTSGSPPLQAGNTGNPDAHVAAVRVAQVARS